MADILVKPLGIGALTLSGDISAPVIKGGSANNIISDLNDWEIKVEWNLQGTLLNLSPFDNCRWDVKAYIEGWGAGKELAQASENGEKLFIDVNRTVTGGATLTDPSKWSYSEKIVVTKGLLTPGPYKLAVTIALFAMDPVTKKERPLPIAGFFEHPEMIQIYEDKA